MDRIHIHCAADTAGKAVRDHKFRIQGLGEQTVKIGCSIQLSYQVQWRRDQGKDIIVTTFRLVVLEAG